MLALTVQVIITVNVGKCMEHIKFGLYSLQIFQASWTMQISSHLILQRDISTVMQLFHPISLENLAEMLQILNCCGAEKGKAAVLVRCLYRSQNISSNNWK